MIEATLPDEIPALLDAFRADLEELWQPGSALERHEVETIARALVRQRELDRLERRVLEAFFDPEEAAAKLPSLDTLVRYRRRLERELTEAGKRIAGLKRARARLEAAREEYTSTVANDDEWLEGFASGIAGAADGSDHPLAADDDPDAWKPDPEELEQVTPALNVAWPPGLAPYGLGAVTEAGFGSERVACRIDYAALASRSGEPVNRVA